MGKPVALLLAATDLLQPIRAELDARGLETIERTHASLFALDQAPAVAIVGCDGAAPLDGIGAVRNLRRTYGALPVIVVADPGSEDLAIAALRSGAADYFKAPCEASAVAAAALPLALSVSDAAASDPHALDAMVGISPAMRQTRAHIRRLAASDTGVLITGETGTGKELVAQLLHRLSRRSARPFVCINCAAIPDTLLESELFGWERGAFTGATSARAGHLSAAAGGTVLLDEIGEMTLLAQTKLLRALDCREIYRLGGSQRIPLDIRVIAATNQNLEELIGENRFRRDLYHRLHVSRITLPPLRERPEDIPVLLQHYTRELNRRFDRRIQGFTATALRELVAYPWPGNVREVRNAVESVFAELPDGEITSVEAPEWVRHRHAVVTPVSDERAKLLSALVATNWNVSATARQLRWCRMTLYRKIAKYRLSRTDLPEDAIA